MSETIDVKEQDVSQPFISYVKCGEYQKKKELEQFLKASKEQLRLELSSSDKRRHEYEHINMVAKFVPKKIYEVDQQGLIAELSDYLRVEWLSELLTLDTKLLNEKNRMLDVVAFQEKSSYYFRPSLNKLGKSFLKDNEWLFGGQTKKELLLEIQFETQRFKAAEVAYKDIMATLAETSTQTIKTEIGSLSRIANSPFFNLSEIQDVYGYEFLESFGKVQLQKLDEYIMMEIIPRKILNNHRTLKDIRLDFVVMQLTDERKALEAFAYQKRMLQQKYA